MYKRWFKYHQYSISFAKVNAENDRPTKVINQKCLIILQDSPTSQPESQGLAHERDGKASVTFLRIRTDGCHIYGQDGKTMEQHARPGYYIDISALHSSSSNTILP